MDIDIWLSLIPKPTSLHACGPIAICAGPNCFHFALIRTDYATLHVGMGLAMWIKFDLSGIPAAYQTVWRLVVRREIAYMLARCIVSIWRPSGICCAANTAAGCISNGINVVARLLCK